MSNAPPIHVLLLAGSRGGRDPLLEGTGCDHKALVPVAGVPMLERVAAVLAEARGVERIAVSAGDAAILSEVPTLTRLASEGRAVHAQSGASPAASVLSYRRSMPRDRALVVTTADHALLTAEMIEHFRAEIAERAAEVCVGVVAASVFRKRYPHLRRTFIRFRDKAYSGANLFAFKTVESAEAASFWRRAEAHRKHPWRLVRLFGLSNLLRFATGRLDAPRAVAEASRVIGVSVDLVEMPFAECAIDVDRPGDLAIAGEILAAREAA